jgi:ribosomal protein S18 acetylase RimI-like enzyme
VLFRSPTDGERSRARALLVEGLTAEGGDTTRRRATLTHVTGAAPVEIQRFYVDRAHHGHGVAATLMAQCTHVAESRGARTRWLAVWERNARAIRFYEKIGFVDAGVHTFQLGNDLQHDRVMMRTLPQPF